MKVIGGRENSEVSKESITAATCNFQLDLHFVKVRFPLSLFPLKMPFFLFFYFGLSPVLLGRLTFKTSSML